MQVPTTQKARKSVEIHWKNSWRPSCAEGTGSVTRHSLLRSESADEDVLNILTAENREGSSCASHRWGCQGPQEHAETGSDDPGDAEGSEARGGADQFQSVRRSRERWSERHMSCMNGAPHFVLTSKAGRTKPKCTKTRAPVHAMNSRERQPMKRCQKRWMHEREQSGSTRRVDRSINAHTQVWVEECPLTTRHEARSKKKRLQEWRHSQEASTKRKTVQQNSHPWGRPRAGERQESSAHVKGSNVWKWQERLM